MNCYQNSVLSHGMNESFYFCAETSLSYGLQATADVMLYLVSMLRLGQSTALQHPIDDDSYDRISLCLRILSNPTSAMRLVWLKYCRDAFVKMITEKQHRDLEDTKAKAQVSVAQPDDLIDFYHLKSRKVWPAGFGQLCCAPESWYFYLTRRTISYGTYGITPMLSIALHLYPVYLHAS